MKFDMVVKSKSFTSPDFGCKPEEREISVKECKAYVDRIKEQMGEEDMNQLIELLNKLTNVMKGEQ